MIEPWKPLEQMDHDELRRYSSELVRAWAKQEAPLGYFIDQIAVVSERMEKLGIPRPVAMPVNVP